MTINGNLEKASFWQIYQYTNFSNFNGLEESSDHPAFYYYYFEYF